MEVKKNDGALRCLPDPVRGSGAGRFACPNCGSVNVVRELPAGAPAEMGGYPDRPWCRPGHRATTTPAAPGAPSPIQCPECDFSFIVGDIVVATCPNCGAEVRTGGAGSEEEE